MARESDEVVEENCEVQREEGGFSVFGRVKWNDPLSTCRGQPTARHGACRAHGSSSAAMSLGKESLQAWGDRDMLPLSQ